MRTETQHQMALFEDKINFKASLLGKKRHQGSRDRLVSEIQELENRLRELERKLGIESPGYLEKGSEPERPMM